MEMLAIGGNPLLTPHEGEAPSHLQQKVVELVD